MPELTFEEFQQIFYSGIFSSVSLGFQEYFYSEYQKFKGNSLQEFCDKYYPNSKIA